MKSNKKPYSAPDLTVVSFKIERGFNVSNVLTRAIDDYILHYNDYTEGNYNENGIEYWGNRNNEENLFGESGW